MYLLQNLFKPLFNSKYPDLRRDYHKTNYAYDKISVFKGQLRHISEIHPVPSGYKGQRHKYRGHDSQEFHYLVLPYIYLGLVHLPKLYRILLKRLDRLIQSARFVRKQTVQRALSFKPVLGRLLPDRLARVGDLFVIGAEIR